MPLFLLLFSLTAWPGLAATSHSISDDSDGPIGHAQTEKEEKAPWRFVFSPNGSVWFWQQVPPDSIVTWDFGAEVLMEIARGRGHRLWFGAKYRVAAGFVASQAVTPFDPHQIDSYQVFSWRWAVRQRREVFLHLQRYCYHEIDVHNPGAVWLTHAAFGFGTFSPAEEGEIPARVMDNRTTVFNMLFSIGPFIYGGPAKLFGDDPTRQWQGTTHLLLTSVITGGLMVENSLQCEYQLLVPSAEDPVRYRLAWRTSLLLQRSGGNASIFLERNLHDDFLMRRTAVGWRFGLVHRF